MPPFIFATGIENSYPTIAGPDGRTVRVDQMEASGHYRRWKEDFGLVRELGLDYLRYGPPYYTAHVAPGKYDWSFADETFRELNRLGITPIADLCHFGVPDWIGGFDNPDWPALFAEYARAFADRYPWVTHYTPVNEIFIAASFSGQNGWWNERATGHKGFVRALEHLCRANTLAMRAIIRSQGMVDQTPVFIQSESSEYFHPESPDAIARADFYNEQRFLALDLTYGRDVSTAMYEYLAENDLTHDEYRWFREHAVKPYCVLGTDYYATNEHLVRADGTVAESGEVFGYYVLTKQYHDRYRLPVMHTETNADEPNSAFWLWKEWAQMVRLRQDGVPIVGFTWYSLTDQVDWHIALREQLGVVNPRGLYDLDRQIRPVGRQYKKLVAQWRELLETDGLTPDGAYPAP
jgi:beta-glucosidase/6-phospho-beta-glucosidase/beta-galactosidase